MKIQKIFFDLDGTITDSKEGILKSLCYAFEKMKIKKPSEKILNTFIGPPLWYSLVNILKLSEEKTKKTINYFRERFIPLGIYENKLFPGIKVLLNLLNQKKNIELYIATSKPKESAINVLDYFKIIHFFTKISAATFDNKFSNKDQIIFNLIKNIKNVKPEQILMVGDRKWDIIGAKKNNIYSLGVLYGYSTKDELKKTKADYLAHSVEELKKILLKVI